MGVGRLGGCEEIGRVQGCGASEGSAVSNIFRVRVVGGIVLVPGFLVIRIVLLSVVDATRRLGVGRADWTPPGPHIRFDEIDTVVPDGLVVPLQQYKGIGILLQRPHINLNTHILTSFQGSCHQRTSARTDDGYDNSTIRIGSRLALLDPVVQCPSNRTLIPGIFDRVFLENFIGYTLEIDRQWLEWSLKIVLISGTKAIERCQNWLFGLQISHV